jgi:hypothetical protein
MAAVSSSTACVILAFFAITGDFVLRFIYIMVSGYQQIQ